jgi:predicted Zn-dependent protease with MMP-like domain
VTGETREPDFFALVEAAVDALPEVFRERLGSVAIVVEDEPTAEQLASVRATGLFGLYHGVPRTQWAADGTSVASKISIFRGPLERAYGTGPALAAAVRDVVHHEVAHHFGIDDARLRELARRMP